MSTHEQIKEKEVIASVPILRVDESLSVDERFTDNTINNILPARYLKKDEDGDIVEDAEGLFERVADNVATAEYLYHQDDEDASLADTEFEFWKDEFETLMKTQRFMPNSPTLMNAGARLQQLAACFVSSPADNLEDIAETERHLSRRRAAVWAETSLPSVQRGHLSERPKEPRLGQCHSCRSSTSWRVSSSRVASVEAHRWQNFGSIIQTSVGSLCAREMKAHTRTSISLCL
jgi:hypothetical protein